MAMYAILAITYKTMTVSADKTAATGSVFFGLILFQRGL